MTFNVRAPFLTTRGPEQPGKGQAAGRADRPPAPTCHFLFFYIKYLRYYYAITFPVGKIAAFQHFAGVAA